MPSEDEGKNLAKILKKCGLVYEGELSYALGGKDRILYVFKKKGESRAHIRHE